MEDLKNEIERLEKMLEAGEGNRKHILKLLKEYYKTLKENCKKEGHDFTDWTVENFQNPTYVPVSYYGYTPQSFPVYTRVCKNCGYTQMRMTKPKALKKAKQLQKNKNNKK